MGDVEVRYEIFRVLIDRDANTKEYEPTGRMIVPCWECESYDRERELCRLYDVEMYYDDACTSGVRRKDER